MGFRSLRVINEDVVAPGGAFGTHPHRDMEILTYVLEGALEHKDSMGNGSVIRPGDVQRMTAGTGVTHSEANPSRGEPVHLLQIWILPEQRGLKPGYEQTRFENAGKKNRLKLVASRDASGGAVKIHQDARVYASLVDPKASVEHVLEKGRGAWLQVVRGSVEAGGVPLGAGDAAAFEDEPKISIRAREASEILLFDLA
jgi:redox-sensitive bicupin YhaK (pirin superfamily)